LRRSALCGRRVAAAADESAALDDRLAAVEGETGAAATDCASLRR